eukprot:15203060-Ditylum_brightwellii.AAC.1
MVKTRNNVDTKSSATDDSNSPTTLQLFQQTMACLDDQKEHFSNVTITSQYQQERNFAAVQQHQR